MGCCGSVCASCALTAVRKSPVVLSLGTTAGWTLGAALISAGRILAASIVLQELDVTSSKVMPSR